MDHGQKNPRRVLITGASGFIGRSLAPVLRSAGVETVGVARRAEAIPHYERVHAALLGESLAPILMAERPDVVVHGALAGGRDAYRTNVEGTQRWLEEATAAGVGVQIFLSSLSAAADALADYGRAKWLLEQRFMVAGGVVFRLGLVVGAGGMFGRLVASSRRYPIVPLLDGGQQFVYVLGIRFLCHVLRDCILNGGTGLAGHAWNIQQPTPYTLRQVIEAIHRHYGLRRLLLPIPGRPILAGLLLLEKAPFVRLPVGSANVKGLIQQGRRQIPSDFARFGHPEETLDQLIAQAVRQGEVA